MAITLKHVKGLDGILETLKALPPEIVSKSGGPVKLALRAGGKVIQQAYVDNVRTLIAEPNQTGIDESSGTWEKSIVVSRAKPTSFKGEWYKVRIRRSARGSNGEPVNKYAGVHEFGDETHPAKAPLRRAFDSSKDAALSTIVAEMQRRTQNAIKKATKRSKQL